MHWWISSQSNCVTQAWGNRQAGLGFPFFLAPLCIPDQWIVTFCWYQQFCWLVFQQTFAPALFICIFTSSVTHTHILTKWEEMQHHSAAFLRHCNDFTPSMTLDAAPPTTEETATCLFTTHLMFQVFRKSGQTTGETALTSSPYTFWAAKDDGTNLWNRWWLLFFMRPSESKFGCFIGK